MLLEHVNVTLDGGFDIDFPRMIKIRQHFNKQELTDVKSAVQEDMCRKLNPKDYRGKRIALTAGSRGINQLGTIMKALISQLQEWGAIPFIVPAMGSHGGATADGQRGILNEYGITEESLGVPILASMDVVQVGSLENGMPIYCDKIAYHSDGIVLINKIKPHADFKGDYESGLLKMAVIGLGKHKGAAAIHYYGFDMLADLLLKAGKVFLKNTPVLFGLGIVENAYDRVMMAEIIPKDQIMEREKELLIIAKKNMAKIMLPNIDILLIEEIGKEISGEGMDPNVTGRPGSGLNKGFEAPPIQKIVVLGITTQSHGNGAGIGMADISTLRCINSIDFNAMYTNSITATILNPSKLPVILNNDQEALVVTFKTCNRVTLENVKIVRIKNTLHLNEIEVSETYLPMIQNFPGIEILTEPHPLEFTSDGWLI
jgi:hypothetical protein